MASEQLQKRQISLPDPLRTKDFVSKNQKRNCESFVAFIIFLNVEASVSSVSVNSRTLARRNSTRDAESGLPNSTGSTANSVKRLFVIINYSYKVGLMKLCEQFFAVSLFLYCSFFLITTPRIKFPSKVLFLETLFFVENASVLTL